MMTLQGAVLIHLCVTPLLLLMLLPPRRPFYNPFELLFSCACLSLLHINLNAGRLPLHFR